MKFSVINRKAANNRKPECVTERKKAFLYVNVITSFLCVMVGGNRWPCVCWAVKTVMLWQHLLFLTPYFSSIHTEKGFHYVIKLPALLMLTVVSSKKGKIKSLHSLHTFVTTGGERSVGQAAYPKKSFRSNQLAQGNMPEFCNTPEELMGWLNDPIRASKNSS